MSWVDFMRENRAKPGGRSFRADFLLSVTGKSEVGGNDLFICSARSKLGLALVTHNMGEFGRVPSLAIEDWTMAS
jgi:predicted nucleic acid-binding protein